MPKRTKRAELRACLDADSRTAVPEWELVLPAGHLGESARSNHEISPAGRALTLPMRAGEFFCLRHNDSARSRRLDANLLHKAESVKVKMEELPFKTFDEIFGEGWWDKGEAEDLKTLAPTNFGQNVHHQINRQNTQIGQIEPNSTDQNPPLTESDHSYNAKNGEEQTDISSNEKRNIIDKFHAIKEEYKTVAKGLGLSDRTIYKWKRKLGQTKPQHKHSNSEQKKFMKLYYEIKDKNPKINDEEIAKMLKIGRATLFRWKKQFDRQQFHPNSDGHSVEENAAENIQEIENSNSGSLNEK
uniref:Uncharacterized protein n=1 Tax=Globodera rostochiensis TaxID=31243 RepID=A0A914H1K9_GLORO